MKTNDNGARVQIVHSEAEFNKLYRHISENSISEMQLLEREKQNTRRIFDSLYSLEDKFWEQCALHINPDFIIFNNMASTQIKNAKTGINVIYPNVMSTSRLEIHTIFIGKVGNFLCSIFEIFGNSPFSFNQIISLIEKDYPKIPQVQIVKTIKHYFRQFLFEQILVLS